jgi:hypothetical protein
VRQHAGAALFAIAQLPDAERVAVLAKLPGVGDTAYPLARAIGCLTQASVQPFVDGLQHDAPELLMALAHRHTMNGSALGSTSAVAEAPSPVASAPPAPEASAPPRAPSEAPKPTTPTATPPITEVMRQHAGAALFAIAPLSEAERLAVIDALPGVGNHAYPIARAVGSLTQESVESFLDALQHLEPAIIVTLARRHTPNESAGA